MNPIIAIIPARGGSKRIPRKNLVNLAGKPLIAHSIEQAINTPAVNRVIVSTDDNEISVVSEMHGAEVVFRPPELSTDAASSESALMHVLDHCNRYEKQEPDLIVFLQATSPLRRSDDIQQAIEMLRKEDADSLFSSCLVEGFVWSNHEGALTPVNYDYCKRPRSQELRERIFEENGSIYIFKPWVLHKHASRLGGKIVMYPMDRLRSFQVDRPDDLMIIENIFKITGREIDGGTGSEAD